MARDAAGHFDARTRRKAQTAATIGCGLEFYDFLTFAFFAIQIGETFFPSHDPYLSLMGSLATFGAGFLARPIGAWVLGGYGDRAGRKSAMLLSMTLMGVSITVLALTPGYAVIGIAAPIIAILARCLQGFALGGEIGSATVYMIEAGAIERRGRSASLQVICQGVALSLGALVGLILSSLLSESELAAYGWRIALLLGAAIVPFALWMRRSIPETQGCPEPEFSGGAAGPSMRQTIWLGAALIGAGTILNYVQNYMTTFGQTQLQLSTQASMAAQLSGNLMIIVAAIVGGIACDRWGRKPLLLLPAIVMATTVLPMILWVEASRSMIAFFTMNLVIGFCNNVNCPALYAAMAESLPVERRTRGFALIYSLPVTVLGGSTQLFITWLMKVTGSIMALGYYMMVVAAVGMMAAILLPESAPLKRGWRREAALA
jgi:MFS family permease